MIHHAPPRTLVCVEPPFNNTMSPHLILLLVEIAPHVADQNPELLAVRVPGGLSQGVEGLVPLLLLEPDAGST